MKHAGSAASDAIQLATETTAADQVRIEGGRFACPGLGVFPLLLNSSYPSLPPAGGGRDTHGAAGAHAAAGGWAQQAQGEEKQHASYARRL